MDFSGYEDSLRHTKSFLSTITDPIGQLHRSLNVCYALVSFVYNPTTISPIRAWFQALKDMSSIVTQLKTFPQFVYAVGSIEPHLGVMSSGMHIGDHSVEMERFMGARLYQPGYSAAEILDSTTDAISKYNAECNTRTVMTPKQVYDFLLPHVINNEKPSSVGYPKIMIAVGVTHEPGLSQKFPNSFILECHAQKSLPTHISVYQPRGRTTTKYSTSSDLGNRHINDPKILYYIMKNMHREQHRGLIGECPIRIYNYETELNAILYLLGDKYSVDFGSRAQFEHVVVGDGRAPPLTSVLPQVGDRYNQCRVLILMFMRQHKIYIDVNTLRVYHLDPGSNQTYYYWYQGTLDKLFDDVSFAHGNYADTLARYRKRLISEITQNQTFYDSIVMTYKWIEYGDFCLNLSSGITTPKDGRYACFKYYPNVKLKDATWTRDSVPPIWFYLLFTLGLVEYSKTDTNPYKIIPKGDLLYVLYEILVPRYTQRRNISLSTTDIFNAILAPIRYVYQPITAEFASPVACFSPTRPFNLEDFNAAQVAFFEEFVPTRSIPQDKLLTITNGVTPVGTRSILIDNFDSRVPYPTWAVEGDQQFQHVSAGYKRSFKSVHIAEVYSPELRRDIGKYSCELLREAGSVVYHLAVLYFERGGGLLHIVDPSEVDKYDKWERAAEFIARETEKMVPIDVSQHVATECRNLLPHPNGR